VLTPLTWFDDIRMAAAARRSGEQQRKTDPQHEEGPGFRSEGWRQVRSPRPTLCRIGTLCSSTNRLPAAFRRRRRISDHAGSDRLSRAPAIVVVPHARLMIERGKEHGAATDPHGRGRREQERTRSKQSDRVRISVPRCEILFEQRTLWLRCERFGNVRCTVSIPRFLNRTDIV